ncbi:hypothetical protein [Thalassotalea sp. G2M2-11]|uniref:hypothetical protein n=1 Tax=Thalassotalea sp. G2M2-11 TaxID=2787627 RepID=UPI0019D2A254|nr:hypothetical protein [Thalassotalea sp. G2M2-11]
MAKQLIIAIVFVLAAVLANRLLISSDTPQIKPSNTHEAHIEDDNKQQSQVLSKTNDDEQTLKGITAKPNNAEFYQQRDKLLVKLEQIENCETNGLCQYNENDPKQSMFEQEAMLVDTLKQLQAHHEKEQVFDQALANITGKYLVSPLGRVQMQAIEMMASQPVNQANADSLITSLVESYDPKVMMKAMAVLADYPQQRERYEAMLIQTLQTGSFYVARTVAKEIGAVLNAQNIAKFEQVAAALPSKTAKAKLLNASIEEYKNTNQ